MPLTISSLFGLLGHTIGSHPIPFIILSLSLFGLSLLGPLLRLDVKMNMKSGFTRGDTASLREIEAHKRFFNSTGEPWYMALFATANSGSILETTKSDELTTFYKHITQIISVADEGNQSIHYRDDLCDPFCNFNSQLWNLINYQSFFNIRYPLSTVGPYKVNIGKHIFNRTTDERGSTSSVRMWPVGLANFLITIAVPLSVLTVTVISISQMIAQRTEIRSLPHIAQHSTVNGVGTVVMYFTTFITDDIKRKQLRIFEEKVLSEVRQYNANPNRTLTFVLHGAHTVSGEVRRGARMVLPFYLTGAVLLVLFVTVSFVLTSLCYSRSVRCRQFIFAAAAVVSPTLAAVSAIGLVLLAGYHINMLVLVSPFLTLAVGIGVDDAFLLTNTWLRQSVTSSMHDLTPAERLQMVLEKVGISMTVTSLTNVLGFLLGCLAPAPEIQLFCACVALSMLFDLLFQLFFYAPFLVLFAHAGPVAAYQQIKKNRVTVFERIKRSTALFCKNYSTFVTTLWAEFLAVALLIAYLYASITGIHALETDLDAKMLLPPDSQSVDGIRIMNDIVWPDYLSVNYIIQNPPNFSDPVEYRNFTRMVKEMESAKNSLGPAATLFWVKDYLRYLANPGASKLDVFFGISGPEGSDTAYRTDGLDMSQFDLFIDTDPYTAWKAGVHYKYDPQNRTVITSMLLMIGYNGTKSLADKAKLIHESRKICTRYAQYDMLPFDTDAELLDVIISVPSTTINTMLFTIGAMGAVFFIFSSLNFGTSILSTLSVASICVGVVGFLKFWGCFLDPLMMVAVIMSVGLSVDYTVHILFHYLLNGDKYNDKTQQIKASFDACAVPMMEAGFSTFLVMFPVLFSPIGVYAVISKAIILVVLFGLLHGLFLLPVMLTALPNWLISSSCLNCCCRGS